MKKKTLALLVTASLGGSILAGCSGGDEAASSDGVTKIEFWAAPNPTQQVYWEEMANKFEEENDHIDIEVSPMKESPTSEASIQTAIAGKSAPTMSENINRGFAAQLAQSQALVPLNEIEGWDELVANRNMEDTIQTWKFSDDNQYVLPIYSNPMLFGWRIDILEEVGVTETPRTYSEVLEAAKKLKEKYPDKYVWAKPDLADPTAWKRWFDFFMLYDAASGGNNFIEGDNFVADDQAGVDVLTFMDDLRAEKGILTKEATDPFESGLGIFTDLGPWTFSYWEEKFPEMKFGETFDLALPPVPDSTDLENVNTFADTKGIVIYASATEEERAAALEFLNWVYENPDHDLEWLETTKLPPARDDLSENESFTTFFEENPELKPYAEAVPYAIPSIDNAKYNELQTHIGSHAVNPVVEGTVAPKEGWEAMKKAIEEELSR
ncbi:ABC transporter substrate-binding protein [Jeotgalibacillus proteolyticus]|uniref:Sugar ABC transporter substrate-binding protein n=1 Tax=Jeotgalibacillus proteolyticus TaxID=2082395 RepID=A0A2S5GAD1_9BACL|nr:ABC transporter substrate-binding protein [Jeotgalibacillus proteolyticus]PPA69881.1 sugar ABC transporter substrate-binding protein [Jeotgalibacillus proteolyticus]